MNNYKNKRLKSGLTQSDMATELGLSTTRYKAIEKGLVKMPKDLIDKFYNIIETKTNSFEIMNKREYIEDWFSKLLNEEENGKTMFKNLMTKFNVTNMKELGQCIGYKDGSYIGHCLNGDCNVPYSFKNKLYNFFNDEKNIQIPTNKPKTTKEKTEVVVTNSEEDKLLEWFNNFDLSGFLKINNITINIIYSNTGIHPSTLNNILNGTMKYKPRLSMLKRLHDYVTGFNKEKVLESNEEKIVETTVDFPSVEDYIEVTGFSNNGIPATHTVVNSTFEEVTDNDVASTDNKLADNITELISYYEERIDSLQDNINNFQNLIQDYEKNIATYREVISKLGYVINNV